MRVGIGYDIHTLAEGRALIIGGVTIPHTHGCVGHSDADPLLHAIIDALLGAAAMGDIGELFPDNDPAFKSADSGVLLQESWKRVKAAGFAIENIDCNVIAQAPKLKPHKPAMRDRIAELLEIETDRVNVKAKTNEGVDSVGRKEAISTQAIVLLRKT